MKLRYKCTGKRIAALGVMACMMVLLFVAFTSVLNTKAEEIIGQGHVNYDVTSLRIRKAPVSGDVITMVDGGFKFDIYEEVTVDSGDVWYSIGFNYNSTYTRGYVHSGYVTVDKRIDYSPDVDFESYLDEQGFPESYKAGLRTLHAMYPNWVFVADHTGTDWNTMVENQNYVGRSLVHKSYPSSWKSIADECYDWEKGEWYEFDSGGYVQASSELVQYALDPRNFLNDTYIFMFEGLSYDSSVQNIDGVDNIISGTFMENSSHYLDGYSYSTLLMQAGQISSVSPYHLATKIIQEQGVNGQGNSISGTVTGYEGYYNYYNIGAYASGGLTAVQNGLRYAKQVSADKNKIYMRPWSTRYKAVVGGAINLGSEYINKGQNTIYYEKFDVVNYSHQYMTNILGARSEATRAKKAYSEYLINNASFKFIIPIYNNMPEEVCEIPTGDGSPNNRLNNLSVDGYSLTPTFASYITEYSLIVDNGVAGVNVSAEALAGNASVSGTGYYGLNVGNNTITVTVTAENGDSQYYVIDIVRKDKEPVPDPEPQPGDDGFSTDYNIDHNDKIISKISVGSSADAVLNNISFANGCYGKIYRADNSERIDSVATGDKLVIYKADGSIFDELYIAIYGDVNGDGNITSMDMLYVKRHVLGIRNLSDAYYKAADANRDGQISSMDMLYVKRHVLDIRYIEQ